MFDEYSPYDLWGWDGPLSPVSGFGFFPGRVNSELDAMTKVLDVLVKKKNHNSFFSGNSPAGCFELYFRSSNKQNCLQDVSAIPDLQMSNLSATFVNQFKVSRGKMIFLLSIPSV